MNEFRETGLDKIQAAVPNCFSRMIVPCAPTTIPIDVANTPILTNTPIAIGTTFSEVILGSLVLAKAIKKMNPLMSADQVRADLIQRRPPHQRVYSFCSRFLNSLFQPCSAMGCRSLFSDVICFISTNDI